MTQVQFNFLKLWLSDAAYAAASALSTGSVLSAFLLYRGLAEGQIAAYLSVTQFVNLAVSLLFAGAASTVRDTRRPLLRLSAVSGGLIFMHVVFCLPSMRIGLTYALILILGCMQAAVTALRTIYIYKLPCEVMDLRHFSVYAGYQGLFIGAAGIGVGLLLPLFFARFSFMAVSGFAFAAAGMMIALSGWCLWTLHPMEKDGCSEQTPTEPRGGLQTFFDDLRRLISNREFRDLLLPNILRGFGGALINMFAVLAFRDGILREETASLITAATYIGTLLSCFAYVFCVKHIGIPKTCLFGGVLFCLICFSLSGGSIPCVVLYAIAYIGYNMVCCAIPDLIYRSVPYDLISIFQTWRLAMTQLGVVLASAVYSLMVACVEGYLLLLIGTVGYVLCAFGYYFYFRKHPEFKK